MVRKKLNNFNNKLKKSFSLIELSLFILISGVLSAVVIISVDLLKQSRAQAIIAQFESYRKAINRFYQDYGYLPGDLPNARFKLAPKEYSLKTKDELIALGKSTIEGVPADNNYSNKGFIYHCIEKYGGGGGFRHTDGLQTWTQLYAAGYITEKYSGFCKTSTANPRGCFSPGYNMPAVAHSEDYDGVWNFITLSRTNPDANFLLGNFYHYSLGAYNDVYNMTVLQIVSFDFGAMTYTRETNDARYGCAKSIKNNVSFTDDFFHTTRGGISNELLRIIDNKIDDGKPLTGSVLGHNSSQTDSFNYEPLPCIHTLTYNRVISDKISVDLHSSEFEQMNRYYDNDEAVCIGVFLLPELLGKK